MANFQIIIKKIKLNCYNSAVGCPQTSISLATKHTSSGLAPQTTGNRIAVVPRISLLCCSTEARDTVKGGWMLYVFVQQVRLGCLENTTVVVNFK